MPPLSHALTLTHTQNYTQIFNQADSDETIKEWQNAIETAKLQ